MKKILVYVVTAAGLIALAIFISYTYTDGNDIDSQQNVQDDQTDVNAEEVEILKNDVKNDVYVHNVSVHPAGHGFVTWADGENDYISGFEISPDAEVEFVQISLIDISREQMEKIPVDAERDTIVATIQDYFEQNKRAIHFMSGEMNEELTEGFLSWVSHNRIHGELRFKVDSNGEITRNNDDWNALPKTDEQTLTDLETEAKRMVESWKFHQ